VVIYKPLRIVRRAKKTEATEKKKKRTSVETKLVTVKIRRPQERLFKESLKEPINEQHVIRKLFPNNSHVGSAGGWEREKGGRNSKSIPQ